MPFSAYANARVVARRVTGTDAFPVDDPSFFLYNLGRRIANDHNWGDSLCNDIVGCNLQCAYCWVHPQALAGIRTGSFVERKRQEMPQRFRTGPIAADDLFAYLERRIAVRGSARLVFSGGEPTLYRGGLLRIAQRAQRSGLQVGVDTNGTIIADLDGRFESDYLDAFDGLQETIAFDVSIRGVTSHAFTRASNAQGAAHRAPFVAIEKLLRRGFRVVPSVLLNIIASEQDLVHPANPITGLYDELASIHPLLPGTISRQRMTTLVHDVPAFKRKMRRNGFQGTIPSAVDAYLCAYFEKRGTPVSELRTRGTVPGVDAKRDALARISRDLS